MNWQSLYRSKLGTVTDALSQIPAGAAVGTSQCATAPQAIFSQLHTLRSRIGHLRMFAPICTESYPFMVNDDCRGVFQLDTPFMMSGNRKSFARGISSYCPCDLHSGASRWSELHHPKVFIGTASPMDEDGFLYISLCMIHERVFLDQAEIVLLEVNPHMPRVFGDTAVHIRDVTAVVEVDYSLPTLPQTVPGDTELSIGRYASTLVEDGATIQLGIGSIPDAISACLMDKHDLGVHTELITNSIRTLVENGVITGKNKVLDKGKIVGAFAYGSQELYEMMADNPNVLIKSGAYVIDPFVIRQQDKFTSINTALAVDLTGQVCSETIGSRHYSGTGGQFDTAYGAIHSRGGKAIIVIPSTRTVHGEIVSTIHAQLPPGSVVSLSRNCVDYIVTEYGIAPMRARSVRERVNNLIALAHPDFRTQLRREAEALMLR